MTVKRISLFFAITFAIACTKQPGGGDDKPIPYDPGTTIYGLVKTANGTPVQYAVVSDGVHCVRTGADGIYQLKSEKKNGMVYICPPPYYSVTRINSQPSFYQLLNSDPETPERHDFFVYEDPDQDIHTRIVFGDIHVYNDASAGYFSNLLVNKVNRELAAGKYKNPVGLTLGDMSWDYHWYQSNYRNTKYIQLVDHMNIPVFNTVGNHDHDMKHNGQWVNSFKELEDTGEDWTVEIPYRDKQGPTCYSWNIGKIHYISMDDAMTIDDGTGDVDGRGCVLGFTQNDLNWLKEDLKFVSPSKAIVLSVHIPFSNREGTIRGGAYNGLSRYAGWTNADMLAPFEGHNLQLVLSAHIHNLYNNNVQIGQFKFPEYNCGAVCGHFWSTCSKGLSICNDGTPNGYRILEWNGDRLASNYFQTLDKKGFYPFRSYDRNKIQLTDEKIASASISSGFYNPSSENYVYINVWDWKEGWSITVTEDGKELPVENVGRIYDPIAMLMRCNGMSSVTYCSNDMRRVKASSPNSTLVITVKDEYGHTATETMTRPKNFDLKTYQNEDYSK